MGPSIARRSSRHLIDSFAPGPIYSQRFTEVSVFPLLKDNLYRVIHLFPFAVVSLGLSVSVLTAPVTHQDQGLQNKTRFSLRPLSAFADPENLRFQAVSNSWVTDRMVVSQPLVAHGVGGQDVDDLPRSGWNG